jgi:O-antigen/teichoic acid export membrane protein
MRTIALVGAAGAAATLIFAFFGQLVLRLAFGEDLAQGAPALPWLTVAMTALAVVYLCVQFLLALERRAFLAVLAIAALVEPVALAVVGADLTDVALTVLGVDFVLVAGVGVAALRAGSARPSPQGPGRGLIDPDPVTTAHGPR